MSSYGTVSSAFLERRQLVPTLMSTESRRRKALRFRFHSLRSNQVLLLMLSAVAVLPFQAAQAAQSRECVPVARKKSVSEPWALECANAVCTGPPICEFIWSETSEGDDSVTCGCGGVADACCHVILTTCSGCGATYPQGVGNCSTQQASCDSGNTCLASTSPTYPRVAIGACTTL